MAYALNQGLARWAFALTRDTVIPDTPALKKQREAWKGFPNAQRPPAARMMQTFGKLGLVDRNRVMVLRTASNPSGPPPGVGALATIGDEAPGQVAAYEANYRVGVPVIHAILEHWSQYEHSIPQVSQP
jgi:purine nucleoside permease